MKGKNVDLYIVRLLTHDGAMFLKIQLRSMRTESSLT